MVNYAFKKPIIILSSPRSGSTLLYETLIRHKDLCSIRAESHGVIEQIPALNPAFRHFVGNNLGAADATDDIIALIKQRFASQVVDSYGQRIESSNALRFVEKTPKNALRVPFLNKVFPDATFIYLVRDPIKNIASMMDAWASGRFVTYPALPDWGKHWSLLLPEGWQELKGKPLVDVAAFQWAEANKNIIDGLTGYPNVVVVKYDELVNDAPNTIARICHELELPSSVPGVEKGLPLSAFTLTPPSKDKWKRHEGALRSVVDKIRQPVEKINQFLAQHGCSKLAVTPLAETDDELLSTPAHKGNPTVGRNSPCPCGSARRYKHCHGKL